MVVHMSLSLAGASNSNPPKNQVIESERQNPKTIAIPPRRTIGALCCFLESGLSVSPSCKLNPLTLGTMKAVMRAPIRKFADETAKGLLARVTVAP